MFFVYIIYSKNHDLYYIGQTNNFAQRLKQHNSGNSRFTKSYMPWTEVLVIEKPTRSEALALEKKLKNLSRERIIKFIEKYS